MKSVTKDLSILFFSLMMFLGNAPVWAANSNTKTVLETDAIALTDGKVLRGEITKFGKNSFTINTNEGKFKVRNNRVALVGVGQELTHFEKYRLGMLDGKRYAENNGGNIAVGFFFGIIGTAIVYLSSDQMPSLAATSGANKAIVNDPAYLEGYSKGAAKKAGGKALLGTGIAAGVVIILYAALINSVSNATYYY